LKLEYRNVSGVKKVILKKKNEKVKKKN